MASSTIRLLKRVREEIADNAQKLSGAPNLSQEEIVYLGVHFSNIQRSMYEAIKNLESEEYDEQKTKSKGN